MRVHKAGIIRIAITIILSVVSILCAIILIPPVSDYGYAVIKIDADINEKETVTLLSGGGIRDITALSTQTVFLDDFGTLKEIPLDQYTDYITEFDPRNDGYSQKLKSFFYQAGKQLVFVPMESQDSSPGVLIKNIDSLLGTIPHELEFIGKPSLRKLPWVLFFAALAGVFYFFRDLRPVVYIFFPMTGFLFWGPAGFILSALLAVLFSILVNPLSEFFTSRSLGTKKTIPEQLYIYRYSWISAGGLVLLYTVLMFLSGIPGVYGFVLFAGISGLFVFSLRDEVNRGTSAEHTRFLPVPISGEGKNILHNVIPAVPFTLAAMILLVSSFFINQTYSDFDFDQTSLVTQKDFEEHVRFQRNFSFVPLGVKPEENQYKTYQLGDDRLITGIGMDYSGNPELAGPALFPLQDLTDHIQGTPKQSIRWFTPGNIISVVCFLFLIPFSFFLKVKDRGRKKIITMYNDKRIAA